MEYDKLSNPYDKNMNRANNGLDTQKANLAYVGMSGDQTEVGAVNTQPVDNSDSLNDLWITSFIRSKFWKPSARGFNIDGQTGSAEFSGIKARGTIVANGGFVGAIKNVSDTYTMTTNDYTLLVDTSVADVTVNLPKAATCEGQIYIIKRTDTSSNNINITPANGDLVEGVAKKIISSEGGAYQIQAHSGNWYIIASK